MSNLVSCTGCSTELELADELLGQEVECPSCQLTFSAKGEEDVYKAPDSRGRNRQERDGGTKFPVSCVVLPVLVIILELFKSSLVLMAFIAFSAAVDEVFVDPEAVALFETYRLLFIVSICLSLFGIFSSVMVLAKKKMASGLCKTYLGITLLSICHSFVTGYILSVVFSGIIAISVVLTIIFFNSWQRLTEKKNKISEKGRGGASRKRRPNVKLNR
jgi:hypothetical protein